MAGHEARERDLSIVWGRSKAAVLAVVGFVAAMVLNPLGIPAAYAGEGCEWGVCEQEPGGGNPENPGPGQTEGPSGPQVGDTRTREYVTPACSVNGPPPNSAGAMCTGAIESCPAEDELRYFVYTRLERWNGSAWEPAGDWEYQGSECRGPDEAEEGGPRVTPEVVQGWVEEYGLPSAKAQVNPGNGRTLVNFENVFYTELAGEQTVNVGPNGIVTVHATPVSYTWHWGDGTTTTTNEPGRPYPNKDVTHVYKRAGSYTVRVDVTYSGWYEWAGTRFDLPGTYTQPGEESTPLTVLSKRDVLGR